MSLSEVKQLMVKRHLDQTEVKAQSVRQICAFQRSKERWSEEIGQKSEKTFFDPKSMRQTEVQWTWVAQK